MARSRAVIAAVVILAASALACDALLGLGAYSEVDGGDSGGVTEDAGDATMDMSAHEASDDADAGDATDAMEATDATDGDAGDASPFVDAPFDGLPITAFWARWFMPNPDAAIAPGADAMLPNPMSYTGGGDASTTALDTVTNLTWSSVAVMASTYDAATQACTQKGTGWHVPTRIELVSLIDFTQRPTIDNATFPGTAQDTFWTASIVPADAAPPEYWIVDFGSGLTKQAPSANWVRCVQGGP